LHLKSNLHQSKLLKADGIALLSQKDGTQMPPTILHKAMSNHNNTFKI